MAKRINYSHYEKQVRVACVKEYSNFMEDKGTDRTTKEKENAWELLANKYADANVTKRTHKQLEVCWKNLKKHINLDASDRKERLRMGGGPHLQPFQMIQSLKPLVTLSREDAIRCQTSMMTRTPFSPILRNVIALVVYF